MNDKQATDQKAKGLKQEVHPALVRGLATGALGIIAGFIVGAFTAPPNSKLSAYYLFMIGGFVLGAAIGAALGFRQKRREEGRR